VQVPKGHDFYRTGLSSPVYSGAKFDGDGDVYAYSATGSWQRIGTWLVAGAATGYYISRTVDSGSLNVDAGAGPLQMNTDREYSISWGPVASSKTAAISFQISSDVSGSPIVATGSYTFEAEGGG
jgi:hypothetical protein